MVPVAAWPLLAAACAPSMAEAPASATFDFAVMGDTPYDAEAERLFPELAREVSEADVAFVIHVGDIKGGGAACTDSLLEARIADLDRIAHPVVYVPGDNEWTDCHRSQSYAPLERLAFLRSIAYRTPGRTLGDPAMEVETQAAGPAGEFLEHQRWAHGGVLFATVHIVGSRNGLAPFAARTSEDDAEVERRISASIEWIREAFGLAREHNAAAVVIAFQANLAVAAPGPDQRTGFEEIVEVLRDEAVAWARPVLLVHGDTHALRVDRSLGAAAPALLRLETFGAPDVGWVRVRVDPTSRNVFGFTPHLLARR